MDHWHVFAVSFSLSAAAGATYSAREFVSTWRLLRDASAGGLFGTGITLVLWWTLGDTQQGLYALVGISLLVPLAGIKAVDLRAQLLRLIRRKLEVDDAANPEVNGDGKRPRPDSDTVSPV